MAIEDATAVRDQSETDTEKPDTGSSLPARAFKVVAGILIAASFSVWVYAYSGQADRPPPDLLGDTTLAARAEAFCAEAEADVEALPSALDAVDAVDRAAQIRTSTARYEIMVDELATLEPGTEEDRIILDGFIGDWRTLLADRRTYADTLLDDPDAPFLQSAIRGERLDRRMTRVADTNAMYSCGAPTDVG